MATAKFYDWKKRRNVKCEVKSKHSTGTFEQTYWIAGVKDNLEDTKASREEYEPGFPSTHNEECHCGGMTSNAA